MFSYFNSGKIKKKPINALFSLMLCTMLILSCKKEAVEKPENLIPVAEMEAILYELAVLNGTKGISGGKYAKKDTLSELYLYERYGIDSALFANSSRYYASKPETYIAMYKKVEARLNEAKQQAEKIKKINDSLKHSKTPHLNRDSLLLKRKQKDSSRLVKTQ